MAIMAFAVIATGGKQYKISEGDVLSVEKISGKKKSGDKIIFDKVLLIDDGKDTKIGNPYIAGATVEAIYEGDRAGKKVSIIRFKSKSNYSKKKGHRQIHSKVTIASVK